MTKRVKEKEPLSDLHKAVEGMSAECRCGNYSLNDLLVVYELGLKKREKEIDKLNKKIVTLSEGSIKRNKRRVFQENKK
jgi:hypothetical protein